MKEVIKPQFYKDLTRKTAFLRGDLGFNNLGLALGTNLKFYNSVAKGLKLKGRKVWRLIPTFVEVTGEKLVLCFNLQFYYFSSVILCSGLHQILSKSHYDLYVRRANYRGIIVKCRSMARSAKLVDH